MTRKKHKSIRKAIRVAIFLTLGILLIAVGMMILNGLGVFQKPADDVFAPSTVVEQTPMAQLGQGLQLVGIGRYSGEFLEDGSDDRVSDVLMIQIQNTGDRDLRFAKVFLSYSDYSAVFEITDLPAGKTVVVLEKNRRTYPQQEYLSVKLQDVVMFKENMDVCSDRIEITGMDGALNVKNISQADISGDLYVYYKIISGDTLYGGITFRAKIEDGLRAGELRQISSAHFNPAKCIIMSVTMEDQDGASL